MSENLNEKNTAPENEDKQQYSLNDDRRVKVLSPGAMVAKRFFRNRIAVVGLAILTFMFLFSFVGGLITPYAEDQQFYRVDILNKEYAGATLNTDLRYMSAEGQNFDAVLQAQVVLATNNKADSFNFRNTTYKVIEEGPDFYLVTFEDGTPLGLAYRDIVNSSVEGSKLSFDFTYNALKAYTNDESGFTADGKSYALDDGVVSLDGEEVAFVTRYVVQAISPDIYLSREFQEELVSELENGATEFTFTDADGQTATYTVEYKPAVKNWSIRQGIESRVYDTYAAPTGPIGWAPTATVWICSPV